MRFNRFLSVALGIATLALTTPAAHAVLLIDAGPAAVVHLFLAANYDAGSEFTLASAVTVNSLGWLDAEGDGLALSHLVGLWDASNQALLASTTVTPTSTTLLSAQGTGVWYLEAIAPLTLNPGTYRVAGLIGDDDPNALDGESIGNGVSISPGYVRTTLPNGGFNYPDLTFSANAIRATVATNIVGVAAPEPGSLALLTLAGLPVVGLMRRRKA